MKISKMFKNTLMGFAASVFFALLYLTGALTTLEYRFYDFFLGFRANRERVDSIVFLNVDDQAIAYYGFFPWPRSIVADGLLRLKEYGTRAVIFDIEFIDRGPQGIDNIYLEHRLGHDFDRSFTEIAASASDIFSAFAAGRIGRDDLESFAEHFSGIIRRERNDLYNRTRAIARDNDIYLAQAIALNGSCWSTINMRAYPLEGEEAERRFMAEELFSYPVTASPDVSRGAGAIDILPALPMFSRAAKGAGYTNVEIDSDGIRRRVYLAQNVHDHWYLQLAFSPLINFLGNPEIFLERRKMTLKQAQMPDGRIRDIVIPLDSNGRMLLDWPKEDYIGSYSHVSFANFSLLDEIENEIEVYSHALAVADLMFFIQFDSSLDIIPVILNDMLELLGAAQTARHHAMENTSDESFYTFIQYRNYAYDLLAELLALDPVVKIQELSILLSEEYPDLADDIEDEAGYISQLINILEINLNRRNELNEYNDRMLRDKFCIIGRVDTGTTDIGSNPFHAKYINVGTHGVVLDGILSESFINPVGMWWNILFMMIFVPIFITLTTNLSPVVRASSGFSAAFIVILATAIIFRFSGVFLGPLGTILALLTVVTVREVISYASSEKEKQFIRNAFSTYVSSDVVKEIIADPSRLQLGGTKYHMTAVFTDVKGFSTISEKLGDPAKLVSLLNKYLSAMSDVVLAEKGTIDKYIGDAIVAFFGAPIPLEDHALRACVSAISMKKIEVELNKLIMEENLSPIPLLTRIGVNTGSMVAGNMGTANKMNYTIMGNAVNLSARLEGVNNQYGTWILASLETVRETGDALLYRKLDRVRVVGINEPVRLCELIDMADIASEQDKKLVSVFHEALDHFEKRNWKQAIEGFQEALAIKPGDTPSTIYLDRLKQFSVTLPDDSWDGVYNLTSK
jgi:adenylate cyclase